MFGPLTFNQRLNCETNADQIDVSLNETDNYLEIQPTITFIIDSSANYLDYLISLKKGL